MSAREATTGNSVSPTVHPVPQHHVHKADAHEVYLTDWWKTGPDTFRIRAHWPKDHHFYRVGGAFDPLLLCETVRQVFPLLCHNAYAVPLGHQLTWERFDYRVEPSAYENSLAGPDVRLDVECFDIKYRGSQAVALSMRITVLVDGRETATAGTRFTVQSPAVHRRLRGARATPAEAMAAALTPPAPLPAATVGRASDADAVLAAADPDTPDTAPLTTGAPGSGASDPGRPRRLRVDTAHPVYFDHPVDHVPGMVLLEALHQLVREERTGDIASVECEFGRYVELDASCWFNVLATAPGPGGEPRRHVLASQEGEIRFSANVTVHATRGAAAPAEQAS